MKKSRWAKLLIDFVAPVEQGRRRLACVAKVCSWGISAIRPQHRKLRLSECPAPLVSAGERSLRLPALKRSVARQPASGPLQVSRYLSTICSENLHARQVYVRSECWSDFCEKASSCTAVTYTCAFELRRCCAQRSHAPYIELNLVHWKSQSYLRARATPVSDRCARCGAQRAEVIPAGCDRSRLRQNRRHSQHSLATWTVITHRD
jgi:hypothetical protein